VNFIGHVLQPTTGRRRKELVRAYLPLSSACLCCHWLREALPKIESRQPRSPRTSGTKTADLNTISMPRNLATSKPRRTLCCGLAVTDRSPQARGVRDPFLRLRSLEVWLSHDISALMVSSVQFVLSPNRRTTRLGAPQSWTISRRGHLTSQSGISNLLSVFLVPTEIQIRPCS
jgi:hypothetical protein